MLYLGGVLWILNMLLIDNKALSSEVPEERPLINTALGVVRGSWHTSFEGRRYAAFEGIPYAQPPLGNLRFEEPQPIEPWTGIWEASRLYRCPQHGNEPGDEDCLYINVYVPETGEKENLEVVAHIHGGGFFAGSANDFLGPKYVMDRDVILVSFNYRLGMLGFLSTQDEVVPGNNGLKDQALALKWVQENIASFGGNPQSVTLTGFSAGAASVHFHYFSPQSKGLFQRGFSLSGTALNPWALQKTPKSKAETVAKIVGCPVVNTKTMVECLKTRPAHLLIDSTEQLRPLSTMPACQFTPVVERNSSNPFLTDRPEEMLKNGKVIDVPWMVSVTNNDGLIYLIWNEDNLEKIHTQWEEVASIIMDYDGFVPESQIYNSARKIRDLYFPTGHPKTKENLYNLERMFTDWVFLLPAEKAVSMQSKVTNSPVYYFRFSYSGQNSFKHLCKSKLSKDIEGTCHGDDMVYFFGGIINKELSEKEILLKNSCLDMLYSYANKGYPIFHSTELKAIDGGEELFFYNISGPQDIQMNIKTQNAAKSLWTDILEFSSIHSTKEEL